MWFNEKNAIKKLARNLHNDMKKNECHYYRDSKALWSDNFNFIVIFDKVLLDTIFMFDFFIDMLWKWCEKRRFYRSLGLAHVWERVFIRFFRKLLLFGVFLNYWISWNILINSAKNKVLCKCFSSFPPGWFQKQFLCKNLCCLPHTKI